ncbi:MAG: response regulator [Planctomycetota bacterium]
MNETQTFHLLVVDDDECDRQLIKRYLRSIETPVQLHEATTASEAVALCNRRGIDLVLLDMRLVRTQGEETLAAFRQGAPSVRLVVASGLAPEAAKTLADAYNVVEFVEKSDINAQLVARLVADSYPFGVAAVDDSTALRVLLVEDEEADLYLLKRLVTAAADGPVDIDTACDGLDAMERLTQMVACEPTQLPDLITLDLNMPRKDGFQTLRELKAHSELREIPVIIHSTCCMPADHPSELALADAIVPKPSTRQETDAFVSYLRGHWLRGTSSDHASIGHAV